MALIEEELAIKTIANILKMPIKIPHYQRPYRWSEQSTHRLFHDTYGAFKEEIPEYRLGSVILHKQESLNVHYDIVDGQQRLTTLAILLYCLKQRELSLLHESYATRSNQAIMRNFRILQKRMSDLSENEQESYKRYLLEKCTIVQIVTDQEQEAFQFFDSQNSRGKSLAPHDLLKSHHLRVMTQESQSQKVAIVEHWEAMDQKKLQILFKNYLYPTIQWIRLKDGLGYSSHKIGTFKGIMPSNQHPYAIYHKASHLFIENFHQNSYQEFLDFAPPHPFQLIHPIIAGKRFFYYTSHYNQLLTTIQQKVNSLSERLSLPDKGAGDSYIKQLYECSLLFFVDRFGLESLTNGIFDQLYTWAYSLRLVLHSVYLESINKYAQGNHERINHKLQLFNNISEINHPDEMQMIVLDKPNVEESMQKKYGDIYKSLCEINGWEE